MATQEEAPTTQQQPPPPPPPLVTQQEQPPQGASSTLPPYPEMIMAAIEALDDKNGSNKSAISKHIETTHPNLPAAHATLLSHHLSRMKETGQLALVKNNYMKPDPNAPPKRGRGRPPKPKAPLPPGAVVSSPRPRGRPPKAKDPFAPATSPKKTPGGSGRPRGRPPKKAKTSSDAAAAAAPAPAPTPPAPAAAAAAPVQPSGDGAVAVRRGRGRPPKVKPTVVPVAG
ncbi:hypothetical protein Tsubulata_026683 [Turnera subulata]|uniref:HMG-Y-related protein A n=1 Tax=Turnera subulata TaxID=218843 RepID=A0A9Q0FRI9_9ROSI|nr:hypothetical protein Tsubulata_026683 [Turnera subulata]